MCLVRTPAAPGGFPNSSRTKGPYGPVPTVHSPHLDEATLNAAHAHVEATFVLPQEFRKSPILAELLQEPLGRLTSRTVVGLNAFLEAPLWTFFTPEQLSFASLC